MNLTHLRSDIETHCGIFLCERIGAPEEIKTVHFRHSITAAEARGNLPAVASLRAFFKEFGSVVFYEDQVTGDAAIHLASPTEWADLESQFRLWLADLSENERRELVPSWVNDCLVVGEEPRTGNYLLTPVQQPEAGAIFLFDHDGFEFIKEADDIVSYVQRLISPDDHLLRNIATHMRFIDGNPRIQWWIRELRDNRGNIASTSV
jgi:hypothetical protein